MSAHSKIGASSMYRWSACAGSVRQCENLPNKSSAYAEEGSDAHALAAHCLSKPCGLGPLIGKKLTADRRTFLVTQEMADAVQVYLDAVAECISEDAGDVLTVEQKFDLSEVHPGCFGTADAVIWQPKQKTLIVMDYKHGAGVPVKVEGNPQLQYYGLGALLASGYPAAKVRLVIVQPRCELDGSAVRVWEFDSIDLIDFRADLKKFAQATEHPDAPLVPGDHCRFCPAAALCPAVKERAQSVAKLEFAPALPYDPLELKRALDSRPVLQAWLKALDEFAYAEAEAGRTPPGYKLVAKRATRHWRDEGTVIEQMQRASVADDLIFEPRKIRSPAQLEKLIPKGVQFPMSEDGKAIKVTGKQIVASLVVSESSGHVLAEESDKRPPVKASAKDEFSPAPALAGTVFDD